MIDADKIDAILSHLRQYVDQLRQLALFSFDELATDMVKLGAAKYYLQVAVESCIDAANHIIASEGFRSPESYVDSFSVLAERGIVDQDFLPTLHQMARLRNRLVHLYWEVDAFALHTILQDNLDDFDRYRGDIYRFVQQSQAGSRKTDH